MQLRGTCSGGGHEDCGRGMQTSPPPHPHPACCEATEQAPHSCAAPAAAGGHEGGGMGMRTSDLALPELPSREEDSVSDRRSREDSRSRESRSCSRSALSDIGPSPLISSLTPLPPLHPTHYL